MPESWYANAFDDSVVEPSVPHPITVITPGYITEHLSAFALWNGAGSNKLIKVQRADIVNYGSYNSLIGTAIEVMRISAMSGGDALTAKKFDTNTSDLPAQITAATRPAIATGNVYRRAMDFARMLDEVTINPGFPGARHGSDRDGSDHASVYAPGYRAISDIQPLTLAEGQGFALNVPSIRMSLGYELNVIFTTSDGSYEYSETVRPRGVEPFFAMFNASGSGRTVYIRQVCLNEVGYSAVVKFDAILIDGMEENEGTTITPIPADTSNASLPSQIKCKITVRVRPKGSKAGAVIRAPEVRRMMNAGLGGASVSLTDITFNGLYTDKGLFIRNAPVVLRENEGLAFLKTTGSCVGHFEFYCRFTVEDTVAMAYPIIGGSHVIQMEARG